MKVVFYQPFDFWETKIINFFRCTFYKHNGNNIEIGLFNWAVNVNWK